jgi:hypothetical protein
MKCLKLNQQMDVCVTVNVKVIFHKAREDNLLDAVQKKETILKAQHLGAQHEEAIAADIKAQLLEDGQ